MCIRDSFYIGNTKISSSSGQQTTFDIPIPTITGEDPNRLSIVADEVIVKERLLVEGGTSKQILSQFDGPVTFNSDVRLSNATKKLDVVGKVNVNNNTPATSLTQAAVKIDGGVGIGGSVFIGGDLIGSGSPLPNISGITSVTAVSFFGDGAGLSNTGATLTTATSGSERVVLTDKTSGTMTTAKTDPQLEFNFATNTLTSTNFAGALTGDVTGNVTGDLTGTADKATDVVGAAGRVLYNSSTDDTTTSANLLFDGTRLSTNNVLAQNVKIAGSGANEIDTSSGNLILDAASNTVQVTTNLLVSGTGEATDSQGGTAALQVRGGVEIAKKLFVGDDIVAFNSSDINLKENLVVIPNAVDKVGLMTGYTYTWKTENYNDTDHTTIVGEADTGVIAQDVEALGLPGITTTRDDGTKAVRYERLVPILIQAVKELSARVATLESS